MDTASAYADIAFFMRTVSPEHRIVYEAGLESALAHLSSSPKSGPARSVAEKHAASILKELKRRNSGVPLMDMVRRHIAVTLLEASTNRYDKSNAPKRHHWVPLCYLSGFTRGVKLGTRRSALVPTVDFGVDGPRDTLVSDRLFIHPVSNRRGFYDLAAEKFFALVESRYSNAMMRLEAGLAPTEFHMASFVSMMLIQAIRAPHPSEKNFSLRSLTDFAGAAAELLDSLEQGFAYVVPSDEALPFVSYAPTRRRTLASGKTVWYFPLTSHRALLLSEEELTTEQQATVVEGSRASTLAWARAAGEPLYGVGTPDLSIS